MSDIRHKIFFGFNSTISIDGTEPDLFGILDQNGNRILDQNTNYLLNQNG